VPRGRKATGVTYADVRAWALALPGASEVIVEQWGDHPTLRVSNKMFASGAPGWPTMSIKASFEDQAELIASDPRTYSVAAYTGRYGWVQVELGRADPDELRGLIIEAWRRTATKRLQAQYDA
jgi:hypothetical protein